MNNLTDIISLEQITADDASIGGGKFAGLAQIRPLLAEYKKKYGIDIDLPKTFAIPTEAYDQYDIAAKGVPEEIVNQAMQCLAACGGNAAVRSSADIEDLGGSTHSGEFESVLFVKNRTQMREALHKVYASAKNVPGAKMGVLIQPMITAPKMAGVIYSQDFNGDPLVVINWTQGKPADYLLVNQEAGNLTKVSKYAENKAELKLFEFSDIAAEDTAPMLHTVCFDNHMGMFNVCLTKKLKIEYLTQLTALANHLEKDLNHPVDLEFALTNDGKITVLQQRPYVMNNKYMVKQFANGDWAGYLKDTPVIAGEVKLVDMKTSAELKKAKETCEFADKILLSKNSEGNNSFGILAWSDYNANVLQSKLKIDACYRIHTELYGHYGNQFRERGTPFLSTSRKADFQKVEDGDWLKIDLRTGEFKTYPAKDKTFNIANVVQMVKNSKKR